MCHPPIRGNIHNTDYYRHLYRQSEQVFLSVLPSHSQGIYHRWQNLTSRHQHYFHCILSNPLFMRILTFSHFPKNTVKENHYVRSHSSLSCFLQFLLSTSLPPRHSIYAPKTTKKRALNLLCSFKTLSFIDYFFLQKTE